MYYPDDYYIVGPPYLPVCASNINAMVATCKELGFAIKSKKVRKPSTMANFLRIDINSVNQQACLDPERLQDTIAELKDISKARSAMK